MDILADDKLEKEANIIQLVCFKLADEEYGVDIKGVQEVIRPQRITPVPQMPDFVLGIINIRGNIIPVFDLRKKFDLPEKDFDDNTKFLVAKVNNSVISFVVDEILDNVKIEENNIDSTPVVKMNIPKDCVKGIGLIDKRMIVIIDIEKINEYFLKDISIFNIDNHIA